MECLGYQELTVNPVFRRIPQKEGPGVPVLASAFLLSLTQENSYCLVKIEEAPVDPFTAPLHKEFPRLLRSLSDAVCAVSLDGTILQANPAFYKLLGGFAGMDLENIKDLYVYPEDLEEKVGTLSSQEYYSKPDCLFLNYEGRARLFSDTSWLFKGQDGEPAAYICLLKDVSQMKNLESRLKIAERNHNQLFDNMLVSIILVDPQGIILNMNGSARKMYGYTREELMGESYDQFFVTGSGTPPLKELAGQLENQDFLTLEEVGRRRKDGTGFYTQTTVQAVYDLTEEVIAYTIMEKDLTQHVELEKALKESLENVKKTQSTAVLGLARFTENRENKDGKHIDRIQEYTKIFAAALKGDSHYQDYVDEEYIENLCLSSSLYDLGNAGLKDGLLLKSGTLQEEEYRQVQRHTIFGGDALTNLDEKLEQRSFLSMGKEIAYSHHEHWDGSGYPGGQKGEDIPLSARIIAIVDVYDALTSKRPYKEAWSHEKAVEYIASRRGSQFDPRLVDVFLQQEQVFERIKTFMDFEQEPVGIMDILEAPRRKSSKKRL